MGKRLIAAAMSACLALACLPLRAHADNPMGYRLLTQADTSSLPHSGSALGMDIERAGHISDDGLSFDIIRVKQVRRGSPGAQAGFRVGDQIIAVDSRVFATLTAFAAYVESVESGREIRVDYIPAGGGPQQAQRLVVTVGAAGWPVPPGTGLSTGTTIAIGVGAAALFGCYELGCFSHRTIPSKIADKKQSRPVPPGMQPQ